MMKNIKQIACALIMICAVDYSSNAGSVQQKIVDFYGHPVSVSYDLGLERISFNNFSQDKMSHLFTYYRNDNLYNLTSGIKRHINRFKLDDAGVIILIDKITMQLFGGRNSNQVFVKYLLLKDLNYDVILTRTDRKLNAMGNLDFVPGRYVYITFNKKRYVDLDFTKRKERGQHLILRDPLRTSKRIHRNSFNQPKINAKLKTKDLSFSFNHVNHEITAESNQSITEFLGDLPMFDVGKEFINVGMSDEMEITVVDYLKSQVIGMEMVEATKFLLSFVQQAVPYGSDYDKYGEERFYYPEETVMSVSADCEDKALLLSYLTKNFLGLNTISLYFEKDQHLSLGIEIPSYKPSGSFTYKGVSYIPCEPTASIPRLGYSQFHPSRITKITYL